MDQQARNHYLIDKALKNFLFASVLTMAITQLNTTADGIIVSHLIAPDALSAINLFTPVSLLITSFSTLFGISATIVAARALGERDKKRVEHLLSTALLSVLFVGALIALAGWLFRQPLSALICHEERLRAYFDSYMTVMMSCAAITMISTLANQSVSIDGHPKLVTQSIMFSAIVNISLDLLLVGVFKMGIAGSAYATITAAVFNILFLSRYLYSKRCSFRVNPFTKCNWKSLGENTIQGTPLIIGNLVLTVMFLLMNNIIQDKQGADGMFTLSVCVNLLSIGMLFSSGIGSTAMSIGGFLRGQQDYIGLRMLVKKSITLLFFSLLVVVAIIELCPELISMLFGSNTPELTLYANRVLRIFAPMLPFILLALTLANIYQMLGYMALTVVIVLSFPVILIPSLLIWSEVAGKDAIWYAFPFTGIMAIIMTQLITEVVRMKKGHVTHLTLVPIATEEEQDALNISIRATKEHVSDSLQAIHDYLEGTGIGKKLSNDIALCIEEILLNIVHHAGRNIESHYIDLHIHTQGEQLCVSVKDDGRAFDPVHFDIEKRRAGLKILNGLCPDIDYQYMYGQNMTFMKWGKSI
jgi:Na+-driven multidrug efflux pump/anti-sigma regulatory factor (Ser/Thr protein kinase)